MTQAPKTQQPRDLLERFILDEANKVYIESQHTGSVPGPFDLLFPGRQDHYKIKAIKQLMKNRSKLLTLTEYQNPNFYLNGNEISINSITQAIYKGWRYTALAAVGKAIRDEDEDFNFNDNELLGILEESDIQNIRDEDGYEGVVLDDTTLGELEYEGRFTASVFHSENPDLREHINKIYILNCTGGPAVQTVLDLEQKEAWTEAQDWYQPWTRVEQLDDDTYQMLHSWAAPEIE